MDQPETVTAVHQDYVDAGAKVIITNTYSTIPSYLAKAGMADRYLEYAEIAGHLAKRVTRHRFQIQLRRTCLCELQPQCIGRKLTIVAQCKNCKYLTFTNSKFDRAKQ